MTDMTTKTRRASQSPLGAKKRGTISLAFIDKITGLRRAR